MTTETFTSTVSPRFLAGQFSMAVKGQADIDPWAVMASIVEDVLDSVHLAMSEATHGLMDETVQKAISEAWEYYDMHYGEPS